MLESVYSILFGLEVLAVPVLAVLSYFLHRRLRTPSTLYLLVGLALMVSAKLTSFVLAFVPASPSAGNGVPVYLVIEKGIFCAGLLVVVASFAAIALGTRIRIDTKQ